MTDIAEMGYGYRFYVKPQNDNTNKQIAAYLNALGESAFSCEHQSIKVRGRTVYGVYELPHSMLTEISKTEHFKSVRLYVQQGEGEIRPYRHFAKRLQAIGRTGAIKTAKGALSKIK